MPANSSPGDVMRGQGEGFGVTCTCCRVWVSCLLMWAASQLDGAARFSHPSEFRHLRSGGVRRNTGHMSHDDDVRAET